MFSCCVCSVVVCLVECILLHPILYQTLAKDPHAPSSSIYLFSRYGWRVSASLIYLSNSANSPAPSRLLHILLPLLHRLHLLREVAPASSSSSWFQSSSRGGPEYITTACRCTSVRRWGMGTKYMYVQRRLTVIKQFKAYTASIIKSDDAIMDAEGTIVEPWCPRRRSGSGWWACTSSSSTEAQHLLPAGFSIFWRARETRVPLWNCPLDGWNHTLTIPEKHFVAYLHHLTLHICTNACLNKN